MHRREFTQARLAQWSNGLWQNAPQRAHPDPACTVAGPLGSTVKKHHARVKLTTSGLMQKLGPHCNSKSPAELPTRTDVTSGLTGHWALSKKNVDSDRRSTPASSLKKMASGLLSYAHGSATQVKAQPQSHFLYPPFSFHRLQGFHGSWQGSSIADSVLHYQFDESLFDVIVRPTRFHHTASAVNTQPHRHFPSPSLPAAHSPLAGRAARYGVLGRAVALVPVYLVHDGGDHSLPDGQDFLLQLFRLEPVRGIGCPWFSLAEMCPSHHSRQFPLPFCVALLDTPPTIWCLSQPLSCLFWRPTFTCPALHLSTRSSVSCGEVAVVSVPPASLYCFFPRSHLFSPTGTGLHP